MKKLEIIKNKKGVTLLELVLSMAVIIIFLLISTLLISSFTKSYKKNSDMNYGKSIINNIANDMKNYVTYGENIRLFDYNQYDVNQQEDYKDIIDINGNLNEFNGINLGFNKIYVMEDANKKSYIKGLSYSSEYYRSFKPKIKIKKDFKDTNNNLQWDDYEPIIYIIDITLTKKDISLSYSFEVEQLNKNDFNYIENPKK